MGPPVVGPGAREGVARWAAQGPFGVPGGAPRDRPRVCGGGIPWPCFPGGPAVPEGSLPELAPCGFPVPLSPWPPGSLPALCSFSLSAACRSSLPRAAHRLLCCWPPRLGPNPAPPSGGVAAAGHAGWPGVRVPTARAFGARSVAARWAPGGFGSALRCVWGKAGSGGSGRVRLGVAVGEPQGSLKGLVGRSRCHAGPPPCSEAAGGETPACVLVAVGCAGGVPRRPPLPAWPPASPGVSSCPGPLFRIGSARGSPQPGAPRFPGLLRPSPEACGLGRCRRRGGEACPLPAWRCPVRRVRAPECGPVVPPGQVFVRCV